MIFALLPVISYLSYGLLLRWHRWLIAVIYRCYANSVSAGAGATADRDLRIFWQLFFEIVNFAMNRKASGECTYKYHALYDISRNFVVLQKRLYTAWMPVTCGKPVTCR